MSDDERILDLEHCLKVVRQDLLLGLPQHSILGVIDNALLGANGHGEGTGFPEVKQQKDLAEDKLP